MTGQAEPSTKQIPHLLADAIMHERDKLLLRIRPKYEARVFGA